MKSFFMIYFGFITLVNIGSNPLLTHLSKRGILSIYWVLNDDDEVENVMQNTTVAAIMTDRPTHVKKMLD